MTFRILQLTDLHLFTDPNERLKGVPTRDSLTDVLAHISAHEQSFDRVVITGDHTHDELETTYRDIRNLLEPWLPKLHTVPGNHDCPRLIRKVFPEITPAAEPITFAFDCGDWRLIGLDSHCPGEVHGTVGPEQLDWLDKQLTSAVGPVGVFMHHPPVSVNSTWMDRISLTDEPAVQELLQRHKAIKFIACGHVHHEFRTTLGSIEVFTTPSTGLQFDPTGDAPTFADAAPGYRVFELNGNHFTTHVVRLPMSRFSPHE